MPVFSILDLAPIVAGSDAAQAFTHSLELAQHAERWGYRRFWLAEHHGMPGIASAATAVVIGHVAAGTRTIRVGAGGIMLPNHSPLIIAEQFGTLESLFPGRIDLGLGRAPGSDQVTSRALRRTLSTDPEQFPRDVLELIGYFRQSQPVRAIPGAGLTVPIWILGSSLFGAQVAASFGLPFAFASHFAPAHMMRAIAVYREHFTPSSQLDRPYVMLGFNVFAGDTDDEGRLLATSIQQAFVASRTGRPIQLPPPLAGYREQAPPHAQAILDDVLKCTVAGSAPTVRRELEAFLDLTQADELMIVSTIFDHAARLRSYEILADVQDAMG